MIDYDQLGFTKMAIIGVKEEIRRLQKIIDKAKKRIVKADREVDKKLENLTHYNNKLQTIEEGKDEA